MTEVLAVLFLTLQPIDVWSTNAVLRLGGVEANPVVRAAMRLLGRAWWVPKALVALGVAWVALSLDHWSGDIALLLGVAVHLWAVRGNLRAKRRLERLRGR